MEPVIAAFGQALVSAMATDTWERARSAMVALWQRLRPHSQAGTVERQLDRLREEVLAARQAGVTDPERGLVVAWQEKLQELMPDNPTLLTELQRILAEILMPMLEPTERVSIGQINMTGTSRGSSIFNQVAGNQTNIRL